MPQSNCNDYLHIFTFQLDVATETINITVNDLNDNEPIFEDDYSLIEAIDNILFIILLAQQKLFFSTTDP